MAENERVIPSDVEAEKALLASIITDTQGEFAGEVLNVVTRDDFIVLNNAIIFDVVMKLHDMNVVPDMIAVKHELDKCDNYDKIGGAPYLIELCQLPFHSSNALYYAGRVKDKSVLRSAIKTLSLLQEGAYKTHNLEHYISDLEAGMFDMLESTEISPPVKVSDDIANVIEGLCDSKDAAAVQTGFFELDDLLGGLYNKQMIVIAGRPSMGKTCLAVNIMENVAIGQGLPVLMFSVEMGRAELITRLLVGTSGVSSYNIKRLTSDHLKEKIVNAGGKFLDSNMWIDDSGRLNTIELRAKARRIHKQHGIRLIVIDYMQLMTSPSAENRQTEVSAISREIKALAKELDIPIIVLSQLNRGNETRQDKKPMMSDLRESGAIEQDADVVILLHRADYYNRDVPGMEATNIGELIVAKQRNGATGTVELRFSGQNMKFYDKL